MNNMNQGLDNCVINNKQHLQKLYLQLMSLTERYRDKNLLITGTTGFLGKVLLEKILYSLSQVNKVYLLIRGKKGSDLSQRFKKEIVSSPCFDRLRNIHLDRFDSFIEAKVKPIQGDLQQEKLGLSPTDYAEIIANVNIIMNCAASIDFNARIDQAIDSNIKGSLRMLQIAQNVKNLDVFTHISTCYVNCNIKGLIREEIYDRDIGPEEEFARLEAMSLSELVQKSDSILGDYPNTYTYTKGLCERLMRVRKGNLPLCIVRPAIINTSYLEPFPGWLDSIAAAAALFLFVGLGIIKEVDGDPKKIGDTVPVDVVVANIIVASAKNFANPKLSIYHVGTSDRNPITWGECRDIVTDFWNTNVAQSKVSKSQLCYTENKIQLSLQKARRKIPIWLYSKTAQFMGKQHIKNAQKMQKTSERGQQIIKIFRFFVQNQWIYESRNVKQLSEYLTPAEKKVFLVDVADIDMRYFITLNNYGLQKYVLKENIEMPSPENSNLLSLRKQDTYFSDIKWAMSNDLSFNKQKNMAEIKIKILSSTRVLQAIDEEIQKRQIGSKVSPHVIRKAVRDQAAKIIGEMVGEIRLPVIRFLAWTLHKVFRHIYEKVNINMEMFGRLREIEQTLNIPIILLPTHRSYIDFLIVSYIFFVYRLRLPYIVSDEALLNAHLLPFLIKSSGAFFYRRTQYKDSNLYRIIFHKYIQLLLRQGNNLEFFIQGTRSRTGKILSPKLEILNILFDIVQHGKLSDICMVPLTINYEKVLEGDTFPNELLGEEKVEESLIRIIKAIPLLRVNFGRVYVEICEPIFMKKFTQGIRQNLRVQKITMAQKKAVVGQLGNQIVIRLTQKIVIMSTGIVSSVLLMHRKGISQDLLIKTVNWISKYILKKGYKIGGINETSSNIAVRNAIFFLNQIITKTKKDIFQLQISAGNQFPKILLLSYYRNTIVHAFLPEAFIGCALASFGNHLNSKQGVKLTRVHEQTIFLIDLLRQESNTPYNIQEEGKFMDLIWKMQQNLIVSVKEDDKIVIHPSGDKMIAFHCSLLRSLIECYWATLVYLITISKSENQRHETASMQKFYDTVQWFMESLYDEKVIEHYEACSLQLIKNAFSTYEKKDLVRVKKGDKKNGAVVEIIVGIQILEGIQSNLKFFIKSFNHNSVLSPMDVAKSSLSLTNTSKL